MLRWVDAGLLVAEARQRAGLSLRDLAARAQTSHSAIAAYEQGRTSPTVATLDRIVRAAGFTIDASLTRRITDPTRGSELAEVLELAAMFPARHDATMTTPIFGRPA